LTPLARPSTVALALVVAIAACAALAPIARAGWGRPFEFAPPGSLDTIPAQIGFSGAGAVAAAFGVGNIDDAALSDAFLTVRSARGAVGRPARVPGAQQVLSLAFDGSSVELLTGTSPTGWACCSSAQAIAVTGRGAFGRARTIVSGLAGATLGQLVTLAAGRMLAAVSTGTGVWATQSARANRFAATHRLTAPGDVPASLAASSLGGDNSILAWTAARGRAFGAVPQSIFTAAGTKLSGPRRGHVALTVSPGRRIDELGLGSEANVPTVAWIESWFDARGAFHSEAKVADLTPRPGVRTLSLPGQLASGLDFVSGAAGDQAATWKVCRGTGSCTLEVSLRRPGAGFAAPASLGSIDASQTPAVAVGRSGEVLVGWVRFGHPVAAVASPLSARFGAARVLSRTTYAADLTVTFGPAREAIVAWTQGTFAPSVVGDAYQGAQVPATAG
jgi:hypothetical protein